MSAPSGPDAPFRPQWSSEGFSRSEFTTAMVHLFRAEVQRANVWRQRLDTTTNWAVITTGATLSFAFGQPFASHAVIIVNSLLVTVFLFIEGRRYRYYELWSERVRLLEGEFFAALLVPPYQPSLPGAGQLARALRDPRFPISLWEALGRRYRRNYIWIYLILALAWTLKVGLHPRPAGSWDEFVSRAALGAVPGGVVVIAGALVNGALLALGWFTHKLRRARGEILSR